MSRQHIWVALVGLALLTLSGCAGAAPTGEAAERPALPQLIQITIVPEPTATSAPTATAAPTINASTPTAAPATPAPTPEPMAIAPARVASFDVVHGEGFPVPVTLVVRGEFDDDCSEVGRVTQTRTAQGLAVGVYAVHSLEQVCEAAVRPYEFEAPLDISMLDVGEYTVTVNGVAGQLSLKLGMLETHNPDLLCATAAKGQKQGRFESDEEAYCFLYPEDYTATDTGVGVLVTARQRSDVPVPLIGEVRIYSLGPASSSARASGQSALWPRAWTTYRPMPGAKRPLPSSRPRWWCLSRAMSPRARCSLCTKTAPIGWCLRLICRLAPASRRCSPASSLIWWAPALSFTARGRRHF